MDLVIPLASGDGSVVRTHASGICIARTNFKNKNVKELLVFNFSTTVLFLFSN